MNLAEISVRRPVTVLVLTALFVGLAAFIIPDLAVDLYPEADPPYITVSTSYDGAGPLEVEESVTDLLENEISDVSGLQSMTSTSSEGKSRILLEFDYETDLDEATADVSDALEKVTSRLPDDADSPYIFKFDISSRPIMDLVIQGNESSDKLKTLAEDSVQPLLERLSGVSSAEVRGGETKVVRVDVLQSRLEAYDLELSDLSDALEDKNVQSGTGSITHDGMDYTLRVDEQFSSLEEIRRTVVATMNSSSDGSVNRSRVVRLEDVADVYEGDEEKDSLVYVNGMPSITLSIQNESDSNTAQVSEEVINAIPRINETLPDGVSLRILHDDTSMIRSTLDQVYQSAIQGALLAMIILFLFLRNVKSTLIIGLSIPISLMVTMMAMYFFDLTLNMISLTGLILGLGMIVDNSIVILENIYRYRERGAKLGPAAILGSKEMITAIVASTLTTLCVFVPLIIWKNDLEMMGQIFQDMIFTVVISLVISLITAITLVPALSSHYLKLDTRKQKPLKNRLLIKLDGILEGGLTAMETGYRRALGFSLRNRTLVISLIVVLFILSLQLFATLGINFQPRPKTDDKVEISLTMPVGTTMERTELVLEEMVRIVEAEVKGYENIILSVGEDRGSGGSYTGSLEITLPSTDKQIDGPAAIQSKLRPHLSEFPEASFAFSSGRRMSSSSPVDIEIHSNDLDLASESALQIRDLLKNNLPQIEDPESSMEDGAPEYRIVLDSDRAAALGIDSSDVISTISDLIDGDTPTSYWKNGEELDIVVQLREKDRTTISDLESQYISTSSGEKVPLSNLATLVETIGPLSVYREDETRIVHVTSDLADGVAVTEIQPVIQNLIETGYVAPDGVTISYGGEAEDIDKFSGPMKVIIAVAVIMVFAIMASLFESLVDPFIIFFSIPMLLIGVVAVYKITGEAFSIFSAVGIVVLAGIVVNNGIVLVDYTNLLRSRGEALTDAVLNAGQNRLRPILMTSLTTILGMVPMGFFPGEGTDFIRPIGQTVVGGLAVSTVITLFITPTMYSLLNHRNELKRSRHKMRKQEELNALKQEVLA